MYDINKTFALESRINHLFYFRACDSYSFTNAITEMEQYLLYKQQTFQVNIWNFAKCTLWHKIICYWKHTSNIVWKKTSQTSPSIIEKNFFCSDR